MKNTILISLSVLSVISLSLTIILINQLINSNTKIEYYESVLEKFELTELINHPELFTIEYIDQVKVHSCMWSISNTLECNNKLYDLENQCLYSRGDK